MNIFKRILIHDAELRYVVYKTMGDELIKRRDENYDEGTRLLNEAMSNKYSISERLDLLDKVDPIYYRSIYYGKWLKWINKKLKKNISILKRLGA